MSTILPDRPPTVVTVSDLVRLTNSPSGGNGPASRALSAGRPSITSPAGSAPRRGLIGFARGLGCGHKLIGSGCAG